MRQLSLWKVTAIFIFICTFLVVAPKNSFSEFDVDWGVSDDDGTTLGYEGLGTWFVNEGYFSDQGSAETFAQTGYIGYNSGDADPFSWNIAMPTRFEIVQEIAGDADINTLGYYTGSGGAKTLTGIFGGTESGPTLLTISDPFGLYLKARDDKFWYTDRTENILQAFPPANAGGDPQALIYELKPGTEWLVAWDDFDVTDKVGGMGFRSDRDYNDMYVKVVATPEPVSTVLFLVGGGVFGLAGWKKRKA